MHKDPHALQSNNDIMHTAIVVVHVLKDCISTLQKAIERCIEKIITMSVFLLGKEMRVLGHWLPTHF